VTELPAPAPVDYLEGLMEGFVAYDANWVMTYINASGERILGRRREDVLGKTWHQAFPHAVGNPVDLMYQRVKRTRTAEAMEYYYAHYKRWMEISASPLSDGGVGVYFREISDRKNAEELLHVANAQLRDGARRKDEFLAVLAHELRNPLAPIANAVELLNLLGSTDPALQSARDVIGRQVAHMVRLIDDLLDVSRITSGKLEVRRERVELAAVVQQALETSAPHLRGHEFTVAVPGTPVWVDADPVRLAQVFSNLLNNACKYTPPGGQIRFSAERSGAQVAVKVRDNGIGIDAEHRPKLFSMFSQAAPAMGHAQGGLGIGLALSRALVEMQGGTLEGRSEGAGRGSEFVVTLPAFGEAEQPPPKTRRAGAPVDRRRVLVVDDNKDSASSLAMLLRADGHTIEVAYDGEHAVEAAAAFRPDAVLLDIGLPGMSGLDACRAIRSQAGNEHVLIAAVTGLGQEQDQRRSREAGFDAHLIKPVAHEELLALFAARRRA
jgi:PAS domain S-box-containing protein